MASVSAENTKIPEEKIKIQCSFLGFVPLKTVEIQQKELPQVLPGGNTIGIFMKTKGILVVGTGSVTDADGMEREPSLGILKSGDYIVKAEERNFHKRRNSGNSSKKSGKKDQTHCYKKWIRKRMSDSAGSHAGWQLQTGCVGAG